MKLHEYYSGELRARVVALLCNCADCLKKRLAAPAAIASGTDDCFGATTRLEALSFAGPAAAPAVVEKHFPLTALCGLPPVAVVDVHGED